MNKMNKMSTREQLLTALFLLPLDFILSGLVVRYGWNNVLTTFDGVPNITLAQAIGLGILVSFITVSGGRKENDYDLDEMLLKTVISPTLTFVLLWFVTLFL